MAAPRPRPPPVMMACLPARNSCLIASLARPCPFHQPLELLLPTQILRRPGLLPPAELRGRTQCPVGITQMWPSQRDQVGATRGNDGVDLIDVGDVADCYR